MRHTERTAAPVALAGGHVADAAPDRRSATALRLPVAERAADPAVAVISRLDDLERRLRLVGAYGQGPLAAAADREWGRELDPVVRSTLEKVDVGCFLDALESLEKARSLGNIGFLRYATDQLAEVTAADGAVREVASVVGLGGRSSCRVSAVEAVRLIRLAVDTAGGDGRPGLPGDALAELHSALDAVVERVTASVIYPHRSPLCLVTKEPAVTELMHRLSQVKDDLLRQDGPVVVEMPRRLIVEARDVINKLALGEEESLLRFGKLCVRRYLGADPDIIADVRTATCRPDGRLVPLDPIRRRLTESELRTLSDRRIALKTIEGLDCRLLASSIEYRASSRGAGPEVPGVDLIRTRHKVPASMADKIVDQILGLDSPFVKDLRGLCIVTTHHSLREGISRNLTTDPFSAAEMSAAADVRPDAPRLYRPRSTKVNSDKFATDPETGREKPTWEGIKHFGFFGSDCIEVQIISKAFYEAERRTDTPGSHWDYELRREEKRAKLEKNNPALASFRRLVAYTLLEGTAPPYPGPSFGPALSLRLRD